MSRGISSIISIILIVIIVVGLVTTAYLFMNGIIAGRISRILEMVNFNKGGIMVRNIGTDPISKDNIKIIVEGKETSIESDKDIIQPNEVATLTILDAYNYNGIKKVNIINGPSFSGDFGKNWPEGNGGWLVKTGKSS